MFPYRPAQLQMLTSAATQSPLARVVVAPGPGISLILKALSPVPSWAKTSQG